MGILLFDFLESKKLIDINKVTQLIINKYDVVNPKEILLETDNKNKIIAILKEFSFKENDNKKFVTMSMPIYNLILKRIDLEDFSIGIIPEINTFRIKNEESDIKFEQDFFPILEKHI
jgi:hypothetical protein